MWSMLRNAPKPLHIRAVRQLRYAPRNLFSSSASRALVGGRRLTGSTNQSFSSPALRKFLSQVSNVRGFSTGRRSDSQSLWLERILRTLQGWREWRLTPTVLARFAQLCAGSAVLAPFLDVAYNYASNEQRKNQLASAFRQGSVPNISHDYLIERPGISNEIRKVLNPPPGYDSYDMVSGYQGTGKTTLVRQVGHKIAGVIYVDILPNQTTEDGFTKSFAKALLWSPPRSSWMTTMLEKMGISSVDPLSDSFFVTIFEEFGRQADLYRKNNGGRSPVLVIDNVNRLAVRNPLLLEHLQDIAKDAADNRHFTTVFVTSEGKAPLQLLARSAVSRLGSMVIVGDLNHSEVVNLVCDKRGKTKDEANEIYSLVGGRIKLIQDIVNNLENGLLWPEIRESILLSARDLFVQARLQQSSLFPTVGYKIAKVILTNGHIHRDQFCNLVRSYDHYVLLLSCNIFAIIPRSERITFHSKPVELVAAELVKNARGGWI